MSIPVYRGQPGTSLRGGAVPPPQSSGAQISPVPGTIQATEAPAGWKMSVDVHPVRLVLAETSVTSEAAKRSERCIAGLMSKSGAN